MAPGLVEKRCLIKDKREYFCGYDCLAIDLLPFEEELWIEKVDELVEEKYGRDENREASLKYIVKGNRMFIFSEGIKHSDFLSILDTEGELQSAGQVVFGFRKSGEVSRYILGSSVSLDMAGKLSRQMSDEYKERVMAPSLREYFRFLDL